jgi:regulator of cell morphogenesis and NO signaling
METESLAAALEREHHEIDEGIAAFTASPGDQRSLTRAIRALRRHIYLEEEFLFPLLCQAEPGLAAPVFVMLREHTQIWAALDALERELDDGGAGLVLCRRLTVQLLHHNLKEEKVLYPRADDVLPPAAAGRLRSFSDSGELPEGWVCAKARPVAGNAGR